MTIRLAITYSPPLGDLQLWRMRLGHTGEKSLQALARQGLLKGVGTCKLEFCEYCVIGKKTTKGILDYVHTDVWGPTKIASIEGRHYFVTFIDDYSRRCWVYIL